MVTQVDKHDLAHIAGDIGPAAEGDGLADQRFVDQAAKMGTHGDSGDIRAGETGKPVILTGSVGRLGGGFGGF